MDDAGDLIGTTSAGGIEGCAGALGCGTVFKVTPGGTQSVLYAFQGGSDGSNPYYAGVIADGAGNLYGTTAAGGATRCSNVYGQGCGTVFQLAPNGSETLLHVFSGSDGANPLGGVLMDSGGTFYGTASTGGRNKCSYGLKGCGTAFKFDNRGFTYLHIFLDGSDGAGPYASPLLLKSGALYGTAVFGGLGGDGTVFKIKP
jgi:uncharacterized repeat protein (TIGR03803 family)